MAAEKFQVEHCSISLFAMWDWPVSSIQDSAASTLDSHVRWTIFFHVSSCRLADFQICYHTFLTFLADFWAHAKVAPSSLVIMKMVGPGM